MNGYLDDCVKSLGDGVVVLSPEESMALSDKILNTFDFELNGLNRRNDHVREISTEEIDTTLDNGHECLVMWDEYSLPVIKTTLGGVMSNLDDVTAVAFDTWVVGSKLDWIIEFNHEGGVYFSLEG